MKCEIRWIEPHQPFQPTPDDNEAIGLCGIFVPSCTAFDGIDGCRTRQSTKTCLCPMIEVQPTAFAICEAHAKRLKNLPNWWFLDFRNNAL